MQKIYYYHIELQYIYIALYSIIIMITKSNITHYYKIAVLCLFLGAIVGPLIINQSNYAYSQSCGNIDTPFGCTPHKEFSVNNLHTGDCTLQWATFYLLPGGQGQLQAYVSSTSSDDSWGFKNIQFSGSQSFSINDLWSPTLPNQDPNISSNGPNWVAGFTYNGDYSQVNHIAYNYHC